MTVSYPIGEVDTGYCSWCGESVSAGRKKKWCSKKCSSAAHRHRRDIEGPWCSIEGCGRGVLSVAKGLCPPHYSYWYRDNVKKHVYVCAYCDSEFRTARTQKSESGRRFCSVDCSVSWNNEFASDREQVIHDIECSRCGDSFEHVGGNAPKYCGSECRDDALADRYRDMRGLIRAAYEDGDTEEFIRLVGEKSSVDINGCWIWPNIRDDYPRQKMGNKDVAMHRAVLEAKEGAPLGSQAAHHKCANSHCVNPDHLQPVTHRENAAEMLARKSLTARISELEAALEEFDPEHELLKVIPVM